MAELGEIVVPHLAIAGGPDKERIPDIGLAGIALRPEEPVAELPILEPSARKRKHPLLKQIHQMRRHDLPHPFLAELTLQWRDLRRVARILASGRRQQEP